MAMTPRAADVADALREGILRGYLDVADAVEWAQAETLGAADKPDPLIAYLARSAHRPISHILLILGQLAWGADPQRAGRLATRHVRERLAAGRLPARKAAHALYRLCRDGYAPDVEFDRAVRRLNQELERTDRSDEPNPHLPAALINLLDRHLDDRSRASSDEEPGLADRDHLTLAADAVASETIEVDVAIQWQWWAGRSRLVIARDRLDSLATELRDFAAHHAKRVDFEATDADTHAHLKLSATEYGRARRAAVEVSVRDGTMPDSDRPPATLRLVLPTEHELVGDFAADLAELAAVGTGVAQLRLLRRWAEEP